MVSLLKIRLISKTQSCLFYYKIMISITSVLLTNLKWMGKRSWITVYNFVAFYCACSFFNIYILKTQFVWLQIPDSAISNDTVCDGLQSFDWIAPSLGKRSGFKLMCNFILALRSVSVWKNAKADAHQNTLAFCKKEELGFCFILVPGGRQWIFIVIF